jgi:NADPH:quinone reductase-like Zn-dependent oxidoreductase
MKALRFTVYGDPSVLRIEDLDAPQPRSGESLIKISASAINPSDVKNVAGFFHTSLPRTPGRDYAGIVVAGEGIGREVWGSGAGFGVARDGAHAQYVCVPADALADKPAHLTMEAAASVGVPFVVAWNGLVQAAELQAGETVMVIGAAGAVGRAVTQIATWRGARVVGVDRTTPDAVLAAKDATGGRGVDVVFDAVGGAMFEQGLKSLRPQGRQIAIASTGERRVSFDMPDFYHARLHLIGVDSLKLTGPEIAAIMNALEPGFQSGDLQPYETKRWPLDEAATAYAVVQRGSGPVKQVLTMPSGA